MSPPQIKKRSGTPQKTAGFEYGELRLPVNLVYELQKEVSTDTNSCCRAPLLVVVLLLIASCSVLFLITQLRYESTANLSRAGLWDIVQRSSVLFAGAKAAGIDPLAANHSTHALAASEVLATAEFDVKSMATSAQRRPSSAFADDDQQHSARVDHNDIHQTPLDELHNEDGSCKKHFLCPLDAASHLHQLCRLPRIYWLNLDRDTKRRPAMTQQLDALHVRHTRVSGFDGSVLKPGNATFKGEVVQSFEGPGITVMARSSIDTPVNSGEVGLSLAHLRAVVQAYVDGEELAIIMEDDASFELLPMWGEMGWNEALSSLPDDWYLLQLAIMPAGPKLSRTSDEPTRLAGLLRQGEIVSRREKTRELWCTAAYAVSRAGMRYLLDRFWPGGSHNPAQEYRGMFDFASTRDTRFDILLYDNDNTWIVNRPLIIWRTSNSFLHADHLSLHDIYREYVMGLYQVPIGFDDCKIIRSSDVPPAALLSLPPIYWINLDRAVGRRYCMQRQLDELSLTHVRVPAVDGRKLEMHDTQRPHHFNFTGSELSIIARSADPLTPSLIAVAMSQLRAIYQAYVDGQDTVIIMEDDTSFELVAKWGEISWNNVVKDLPNDWMVTQLCYSFQSDMDKPWSDGSFWLEHQLREGRRVAARSMGRNLWSAGAYAIHRRGMKYLLEKLWPTNVRHIELNECSKGELHGDFDFTPFPDARADFYIYHNYQTHVTARPLFLWNQQKESFLHDEHLGLHDQAYMNAKALYNIPFGQADRAWPDKQSFLFILPNMEVYIPANFRALQIAQIIRNQGHTVVLASTVECMSQPDHDYIISWDALKAWGIEYRCLNDDFKADSTSQFENVLQEHNFHTIFMYTFFWWGVKSIPEMYIAPTRIKSPSTRVALFIDDANVERQRSMGAAAESLNVTAIWTDKAFMKETVRREREALKCADMAIFLTERDKRLVVEDMGASLQASLFIVHWGTSVTNRLPYGQQEVPTYSERSDLVFLGRGDNPTNHLGILWFARHVYPILKEMMGTVPHLHVIGGGYSANFLEEFEKLGVNMTLTNHLSTPLVIERLQKSRILLAPIIAGTGVNTKLIFSACSGIPILTTPLAAEGMRWKWISDNIVDKAFAQAETPHKYAELLMQMYTQEWRWNDYLWGSTWWASAWHNRDVTLRDTYELMHKVADIKANASRILRYTKEYEEYKR